MTKIINQTSIQEKTRTNHLKRNPKLQLDLKSLERSYFQMTVDKMLFSKRTQKMKPRHSMI